MAMRSPFIIALSTLDESVLHARARSSRSAHRDVIRARIVLAAAEGATNTEIAAFRTVTTAIPGLVSSTGAC